ncbi:Nlrc3, partial [Symbiodinium sp. KB8]
MLNLTMNVTGNDFHRVNQSLWKYCPKRSHSGLVSTVGNPSAVNSSIAGPRDRAGVGIVRLLANDHIANGCTLPFKMTAFNGSVLHLAQEGDMPTSCIDAKSLVKDDMDKWFKETDGRVPKLESSDPVCVLKERGMTADAWKKLRGQHQFYFSRISSIASQPGPSDLQAVQQGQQGQHAQQGQQGQQGQHGQQGQRGQQGQGQQGKQGQQGQQGQRGQQGKQGQWAQQAGKQQVEKRGPRKGLFSSVALRAERDDDAGSGLLKPWVAVSSPVSVAAAMVVSLLLLLVTARALVLPDLVEDVADAVELRMPVANASASLQGRAVALDFAVGGHVALKARPPTALAENPAWLPDKEQIQELSPKQARQRLGFFVSAHILAWMLLCLIGTAIMTRCCGRFADPSGYERSASASAAPQPLNSVDVWRAFLGTYAISLLAVFGSLRSNRLSKATGLDFEVYLLFFLLQGMRLLRQAATVTRSLSPGDRFPIDTFALGTVAAIMPFLADTFDTLKDVVFAGLCLLSKSLALNMAGFASLAWLPWVHCTLLRDTDCVADLSGSYFPFASAQPVNDEAEAAEGEECCWPKVEKCLHELYKLTAPGKIRLLLWEGGPQGVFALLYVCLEGGSKFVPFMQLALPLLQTAFGWLGNEQLGRWTMRSTGKRLCGAFASGNIPLQTSLLQTILDAEEELGDTALAEARRGINPELLTKTTLSRNDLEGLSPWAVGAVVRLSKTLIRIKDFGNFDLAVESAKALAAALEKNATVNHIDFGYNKIGEEGGKALAAALEKNATVAHLDLRDNYIGEEGAKALAAALEKNATVAYIDLALNSIGVEGAKALAAALEKNVTVAHIKLYNNHIGDEGAKALAAALEKNSTVADLDLGRNNIGNEGAKALAAALEKNATVVHIDLKFNKIGDEGTKALAAALEKNVTVAHIKLYNNDIGEEGAKALAAALEKNSTVADLDLGRNNIGNEGAKALAAALEKNATVAYINLCGNKIGVEGAKALAAALEKNATVAHLDLKDNYI